MDNEYSRDKCFNEVEMNEKYVIPEKRRFTFTEIVIIYKNKFSKQNRINKHYGKRRHKNTDMSTQDKINNPLLIQTQLSGSILCPECGWEMIWEDNGIPHKKVECINNYCELFGKKFAATYPQVILREIQD